VPNRRGSITSSDGQILAEDGIGTTISLIPKNIDPSTEEALYRRLSEIFDNTVSFDAIQARVRTTTRYSEPIDIGSLYLPEDIRDELLSRYTGGAVILTPAIVRRVYGGDGYVGKTGNMYSDDFGNLLYSPVTSNGISGLEKTYDTDLSAEGICTLSIHDASGRITLIKDWPVKEATSVRLP